ncbi:MAG: AMP-binding protein [Mycobacterium sp.]|uniref:class I adenylate-forming enzyme family protein n=1 Tax=Mycobacterium sp. TaxID=1785 RepID=UPI003C50E275
MVDLLPDQLRLMASAYPDEVAYRNLGDESSITFGRWEQESNRLAHGLQAKGVRKGDLVAIDLEAEQILDFIVTYSAVHKIGAVSVPMNNRLSPPEMRSILEHAEVTALVCSGAFEDAVTPLSESLASLAVVAAVGPAEHGRFADLEDIKSEDTSAIQVPVDATDLADVMYTSGTTGMPKGVAVRHGNIATLPNALPPWNGLKWLTATPVFTFAGLGFIYNPMKAGMTVLHLPRFDAGPWLDIVERERPAIAFVVPAMARLLIHHPNFDSADLSSLQRLFLGSAPLSPDTVERLQARLPGAAVLNSYGMTEGGHATFAMDPEGARTRPGAVGRPAPPVEVRIVDDEGKALPIGETGEVITRNPRGHREYYRNPEATARMWEGGWLHTGDLGYLDADGYLYIVGRKKEMVVRGGMNIHADDVEAVLQAHPQVVEAALVGIPHEVLGEDIAAYVVLRPGATVSTAELQSFARERLADYKVPRRVHYLPALPRNAGGNC